MMLVHKRHVFELQIESKFEVCDPRVSSVEKRRASHTSKLISPVCS